MKIIFSAIILLSVVVGSKAQNYNDTIIVKDIRPDTNGIRGITPIIPLQTQSKAYKNGFVPSYGCSFQYHFVGELGLQYGIGKVWDGTTLFEYGHPYSLFYPRIATEFYFVRKDLCLGPKIALEYIYRWFCTRANIIDYINFHDQHDLRFTPEIGIAFHNVTIDSSDFFELINVYYGYNIPVGENRIADIPGNRVTISINLIQYHYVDNTVW